MLVSVLIPTRNRLALLREALASVRRQTHSELEILVSDDGSSDGTAEFLADLAAKDPRLHALRGNPVPGIFTNMGFLMRHAKGDAFCFLGDDDLLEPVFVERMVGALSGDLRIVAGTSDLAIVDVSGQPMVEATRARSMDSGASDFPEGILRDAREAVFRQAISFGFTVFRSSAMLRETFDPACGTAADVDFMLRATEKGLFYYCPDRLGTYRFHAGTASSQRGVNGTVGMVHALRKHLPRTTAQRSFRDRLMEHASWWAARATLAERRAECFGYLRDFVAATGVRGAARAGALAALNVLPAEAARRADGLARRLSRLR